MTAILLSYVFPGAGAITSSLIYLSTLPTVQKALRANSTTEINSIVYAMMIVNGSAWMFYGCIIKNWFVFLANIVSIPLGVYYYSMALLLERELQVCSRSAMTLMAGETLVFLAGGLALIALDSVQARAVMGGVATFLVVAFLGSPFSSLYSVITTKSAANIDAKLAWATLINGVLWLVYGIILVDPIIYSPNVLGISIAITQLLLKRVYPQALDLDLEKRVDTANYVI